MLLFFYNEIKGEERKPIEEHFLHCSRCSKNYESLNKFLCIAEKEKVDISRDSLNDILKQIETQTQPVSVISSLMERIVFIVQGMISALAYRPQIAVVTLVIIAAFSLLPIINKGRIDAAKEDIVDIEMELVFEDSNNTDVILDIFSLDSSSQKSSSTYISS
jgi:hypothetical protein